MTDFDNMMVADAAVFMDGFGKEALAIYTPVRRAPLETGIKVMYDPKTFAPDALMPGNAVIVSPQITIETAALSFTPKHKDRLEFNGIKVEVENNENEGDEAGLTTLRVRVISNAQC